MILATSFLCVTFLCSFATVEVSAGDLSKAVRVQECLQIAVRETDPDLRLSLIDGCNGHHIDPCLYTKCALGYRCYLGSCRKVMQCGQSCDYPKWICDFGLTCKSGKCTGSVVSEGGSCRTSCSTCVPGTRCYQGICRKEMGCGESCDHPIWICKPGLSCSFGKCIGGVLGEGSSCSASCSSCKTGTRCYLGICRKEMGAGEKCDYPKWICKTGLTCQGGRCHYPEIEPLPCKGGSVCAILK